VSGRVVVVWLVSVADHHRFYLEVTAMGSTFRTCYISNLLVPQALLLSIQQQDNCTQTALRKSRIDRGKGVSMKMYHFRIRFYLFVIDFLRRKSRTVPRYL
jgi:hypothetical protein